MMTVFNRRELITLVSMEMLFHVREALSGAGIESRVKSSGGAVFTAGRKHGIPFLDQDSAYTYTVYVHRNDYDRGMAAIQPVLRKGGTG